MDGSRGSPRIRSTALAAGAGMHYDLAVGDQGELWEWHSQEYDLQQDLLAETIVKDFEEGKETLQAKRRRMLQFCPENAEMTCPMTEDGLSESLQEMDFSGTDCLLNSDGIDELTEEWLVDCSQDVEPCLPAEEINSPAAATEKAVDISVHSISSPCQQSMVVHNNPPQARPTPLKETIVKDFEEGKETLQAKRRRMLQFCPENAEMTCPMTEDGLSESLQEMDFSGTDCLLNSDGIDELTEEWLVDCSQDVEPCLPAEEINSPAAATEKAVDISVHSISSPCQQSMVVHNNPPQARPTPLKETIVKDFEEGKETLQAKRRRMLQFCPENAEMTCPMTEDGLSESLQEMDFSGTDCLLNSDGIDELTEEWLVDCSQDVEPCLPAEEINSPAAATEKAVDISVHSISSPCQQSMVVHNNPPQARPTPLKETIVKDFEEGKETLQAKRRRMLQFCPENAEMTCPMTEDGLSESLQEMDFSGTDCLLNSDGIDELTEEWLVDCSQDVEPCLPAEEINSPAAATEKAVDISVHSISSPCQQSMVVHNNPPQARPTPLKGGRNIIGSRKVRTAVAFPFELIKPCSLSGNLTLNDINKRIRAPPLYKIRPKSDEEAKSLQASSMTGKPVVNMTKIHTQGGKGSITITRTRG